MRSISWFFLELDDDFFSSPLFLRHSVLSDIFSDFLAEPMFLFMVVLLLLRKIDSAQEQITKLTRELALQNTHYASTKK